MKGGSSDFRQQKKIYEITNPIIKNKMKKICIVIENPACLKKLPSGIKD